MYILQQNWYKLSLGRNQHRLIEYLANNHKLSCNRLWLLKRRRSPLIALKNWGRVNFILLFFGTIWTVAIFYFQKILLKTVKMTNLRDSFMMAANLWHLAHLGNLLFEIYLKWETLRFLYFYAENLHCIYLCM